jgi:hypothetical protein
MAAHTLLAIAPPNNRPDAKKPDVAWRSRPRHLFMNRKRLNLKAAEAVLATVAETR